MANLIESQLVNVSKNIQDVQSRLREAALRSERKAEEITLVAVSKTVGIPSILEAIDSGIKALGESRIQEAKGKWSELREKMSLQGCQFHLVGHLQRNKVKEAVRMFDLIHSLDSERLTAEIDRRAEEIGKRQRVLIEVNTSGEDSKSGVVPEAVGKLVEVVERAPNLFLEGLMTIGPLEGGIESARRSFQILRQLRDELGGKVRLPELSMGMTQDFEVAVEEGATMVRVGMAIFGKRN